MPELRRDPLSNRWVIIATERSKRPSDFKTQPEERRSNNCPFCPGNESQTPPEVAAYGRKSDNADTSGWSVRVVPNKFPALAPGETNAPETRDTSYLSRPGAGIHEVIVEGPEHNYAFGDLPPTVARQAVIAWRDRIASAAEKPYVRYGQLFKNHRATAGASLEHPHSQLIATPLVPPVIEDELTRARSYQQTEGHCLLCTLLKREEAEGKRLVHSSGAFLAWTPYASRFPFEIIIAPRVHQADYTATDEDDLKLLAVTLQIVLNGLKNSLQDPPFNLVLHTVPFGIPAQEYYHWHLELMPRLTVAAGFEWGTGIFINPTPPEEAAGYLREAILKV